MTPLRRRACTRTARARAVHAVGNDSVLAESQDGASENAARRTVQGIAVCDRRAVLDFCETSARSSSCQTALGLHMGFGVGVIRDEDEERRARIDEMLEQLRHQIDEMKRLQEESTRRRQRSRQLREGAKSKTNRKQK